MEGWRQRGDKGGQWTSSGSEVREEDERERKGANKKIRNTYKCVPHVINEEEKRKVDLTCGPPKPLNHLWREEPRLWT